MVGKVAFSKCGKSISLVACKQLLIRHRLFKMGQGIFSNKSLFNCSSDKLLQLRNKVSLCFLVQMLN